MCAPKTWNRLKDRMFEIDPLARVKVIRVRQMQKLNDDDFPQLQPLLLYAQGRPVL